MDKDDPLHALIRQAACAHAWLLDRLRRQGGHDEDGLHWLSVAHEHAEDLVKCAAARMEEPDPFLPTPAAPEPDPVSWYDAGFSSLLLQLVLRYAQPPKPTGSEEDAPYGAMAETAEAFTHHALRRVSGDGQALEPRICAFIIPAALVWDEGFLQQAMSVLDGRISKRAVLKAGMAALKASGLPDDPWRYLEPQLDRYAKAFGIGFLKKKGIRAGLWLAK